MIGRGGMGTVYRAVDLVLGRAVAVKTLPGLIAEEDPSSVARFEREARAAARLSHPAVVSVYDTGADASTHFIVMELVPGRSLEAILREEGRLDPDRAVAIAGSVAEALAVAHAAGIVHRDIKPANVMVADDGSVKVLDFGIARALGASTITQNAAVLGTAAYMAPEQALGQPADERSDIYSLGCVLYALLVGRPPFTGEGSIAIMSQHANTVPRPPGVSNPRVPLALSALVMQMLAKAPEERPRSAAEVRDRLAGRVARATETEPTARMAAKAAPVRRPAHRRTLAAGALAVVALAIVLAVLVASGGGPSRSAAIPRRPKPGATASRRGAASVAATRTVAPSKAATATTAGKRAKPAKPAGAPSAPGASTTGSSGARAPQSVVGALRALIALAAEDARAGTIAPAAGQQLATTLEGALKSWAMGGAANAQQQLATLEQQAKTLEEQGQIAATAVPALTAALTNLGKALASAPPSPAPTGVPPAAHLGPPGHAGVPTGHAGHGRFGRHHGLGGH